jgi:hypothetical protein
MDKACSTNGRERERIEVIGKRPLGRPGSMWMVTSKEVHIEIG